MAKYKIGYIDEDEREVKTFQRKLRDYDIEVIGYEFNVGMTKDELLEQVYSSDIDLLLIDYKLKGAMVTFNGEEIESDIYMKKPLFPYIVFTSDPSHAEDFVEDLKTIYDKEELFVNNKSRNDHFVKILERSIEQYRSYIEVKKDTISELLIRSQEQILTPSEQDTLISLQRELRDLDKTKIKEIPEKLISVEQIEDLSKTRKEAENFLQSLIERNKNI